MRLTGGPSVLLISSKGVPVMRNLLRMAILAAAAFGSAAASAETVTVTAATMPTTPQVVHLNAPYNENVYSAPQLFTLADGSKLIAYCIDLEHMLQPTPLSFHTTTLEAYFPGATASQLQQLAGLLVAGSGPIDQVMNAYQSAIWDKLVPNVVSSADTAFMAQVNALVASGITAPTNRITVLQSDDGSQTFAVVTAVPEPGTWALLIVGFGGMGLMVRSRRQRMPLALA